MKNGSDHILIHTDKVADTAAHDEQMEDLMGTEVFVERIEYREL